MKVLILCGLLLAGALLADAGGQELCGLDQEQIKKVLTCMGDHVNSELKGKAKEIIHSQGDNLAQLVKRQCEAEVDFEEEAEAIKKAYSECKPAAR
ncbi:hypothetical protein HPB50_008933 [Hyalomma asiaticum]|uniref:Uncharacterized protein n=1 Tax=Hyalomma asiaticum TaxID=266040 RepID=A0ACB7TDE8_HYAAI|nr:hypothetical protein HPB50_008933 [Hyalomma asiaticum]